MEPYTDYLGDGAYIDYDGMGSVVLSTKNGIEDTNTIVLDAEVAIKLLKHLEKIYKEKQDAK